MAKKKKEISKKTRPDISNVEGLHAEVLDQAITETLEINYMPYAMSVIVSRAIPEIDGFKPSHRKLLYTMYKMGLLTGTRSKSANIVGSTMKLNPHGDAAIYETMVRLSKGHQALLTPFVDSKGNFGKFYSRDMAYAASRYTEAKLSPICVELFRDIDKDTVDFTDNYDGTLKEPTLLPTTFPNILVSANMGIAVGMASQICGFNLAEVCETTINYIKDPNCDIMQTLLAPDFATGGELIYDYEQLLDIYKSGRGSFKVRARWRYVKADNIIEVYEIPYTTTVEAIIDKVAELIKSGKVREINDMRDETDLGGLKIAIDLKRGTDPEMLMQKLMKSTPLCDSFACNFNILIAGNPSVMGVREILREWTAWRIECVRRRVFFDLSRKTEKLHLLSGLEKILLDIDKAISIIRSTELESYVVPNLMIGFGIDQIQAEYVAEIKLRNINKEYILKRVDEIDTLKKEIKDLENILSSSKRVNKIITDELSDIIKKHSAPRRTIIVDSADIEAPGEESFVEDYAVTLFLSREGYFKKITPLSLRMGGEQKYKESDGLMQSFDATNSGELLFFTDKQQVYKVFAYEFEDSKASVLGVYLPTDLEMDEGENVIGMINSGDYQGDLLIFFENGKAARAPLSSYATKTRRKRLTNAYSDRSPVVSMLHISGEEREIAVTSTAGRALVFSSALLAPKASRNTLGVSLMNLKAKHNVESAAFVEDSTIKNTARYRAKSIPIAGALLRPEDRGEEQLEIH